MTVATIQGWLLAILRWCLLQCNNDCHGYHTMHLLVYQELPQCINLVLFSNQKDATVLIQGRQLLPSD